MKPTTHTLVQGETTFYLVKRGLLVTICGEHTFTRFYIPRVASMSETTLGKNTTVRFGRVLTLIMPTTMWNEHDNKIIAAAMGEDAVL